MTLLNAKKGGVVRVEELSGGKEFAEKLHGFGIWKGMLVKVIKHAPLGGPVLVEDLKSGARIMLGRGMAEKVMVADAGLQ